MIKQSLVCLGIFVVTISTVHADTLKSTPEGTVFKVEIEGSGSGISEDIFNLLYEKHAASATASKSTKANMIGVEVKGKAITASAFANDLMNGVRKYLVHFELDVLHAFKCLSHQQDSYRCFTIVGPIAEELKDLLRPKTSSTYFSCAEADAKARCTLKYEYVSSSGGGSSWD